MNQAHADMDDMGEWAESHPITQRAHRALPLDPAWPTRRAFVPQGCYQQGRLEPTIPPSPAEACTEIGADDQSDSADAEVMGYLLKGLVVVFLALFSAWCIANYLEASQVDGSNCVSVQKGGSVEFRCEMEPGKVSVMRWSSK